MISHVPLGPAGVHLAAGHHKQDATWQFMKIGGPRWEQLTSAGGKVAPSVVARRKRRLAHCCIKMRCSIKGLPDRVRREDVRPARPGGRARWRRSSKA